MQFPQDCGLLLSIAAYLLLVDEGWIQFVLSALTEGIPKLPPVTMFNSSSVNSLSLLFNVSYSVFYWFNSSCVLAMFVNSPVATIVYENID